MGANDHRGVANLDPRDMLGRIYLGTSKHRYMQNIQASGRVVTEKKIFLCFSYNKPMADNDTLRRDQFETQGHSWQELLRGILIFATHKI